jgi:hypothetical protein
MWLAQRRQPAEATCIVLRDGGCIGGNEAKVPHVSGCNGSELAKSG